MQSACRKATGVLKNAFGTHSVPSHHPGIDIPKGHSTSCYASCWASVKDERGLIGSWRQVHVAEWHAATRAGHTVYLGVVLNSCRVCILPPTAEHYTA